VSEIVYALCALTSLLCTILLLRAYVHGQARFLLWSGICFAGLTLNNVFLFLDKVVFPDPDLQLLRTTSAVIALLPLLYGMIWDAE
jgi:hypothetical protein